jgi:hypothetical protein
MVRGALATAAMWRKQASANVCLRALRKST